MSDRMRCMEVWGGNRAVEQHFHMPGLDVWLHSSPHDDDAAGGDVYYLSSCASGRVSRWLLADVSGHGNGAAGLALRLRDLMRRHVNSVSQTEFVEAMNKEFNDFGADGNFATAVVGTFYASTRSFQLCVAGHPPPLIRRKRTGKWEILEGEPNANLPLGIADGIPYRQSDFILDAGDILLAYTDGVTETRLNAGNLLDTDGLLDLLHPLDPDKPERIIEQVRGELRGRSPGPAADDVSLLLARADGTQESLLADVLAPLRYFGGVRDKTRFREVATNR